MNRDSDRHCGCGERKCGPEIARRDLLKLGGALAAGTLVSSSRGAMAGPFTADDFQTLVPADKKLAESWIRSLYQRGQPEWFTGAELKHIGLPIGGLCCGHVYLGGDGRLWHWNVFNQSLHTGSEHYQFPMETRSAVDLGFAIQTRAGETKATRTLDSQGFKTVRFRGAYPLGLVEYADDQCPVTVSLEAYSPFVPLQVDRSSLPLTVMRYTVKNGSAAPVACRLSGRLANPVLLHTASPGEAELVNTVRRSRGALCVQCTAEPTPVKQAGDVRPDIVFDDFESGQYEKWTVEGTAFGKEPITAAQMPSYQGDVGARGKRLVNSHNTRQGEDVAAGDAHVGTMTSQPFTIQRGSINFLIGGGGHKGKTCLNLLVDGKVVATAVGPNNNRLRPDSFDVRGLAGKTAQLQIVDQFTEGWGNIGVDHIVFSDKSAQPKPPIPERPDWGDMTLAVLDDGQGAATGITPAASAAAASAAAGDASDRPVETARGPAGMGPKGEVAASFILAPGETRTVSFAVAWR
ncbi:MAG: GH116 family glycosyl-hydrolase, partial [Thermoguttaceae bacterium]